MSALRLLVAVSAVLCGVVLPATAGALPPSTGQTPLELRPEQGPADSSTIVSATGFTAGEQVQVRADGAIAKAITAAADGSAAAPVPMPGAPGDHRVELFGVTSGLVAAGVFTTTPDGAARPEVLVTPRPATLHEEGGVFSWRFTLHAVNFAPSMALAVGCYCDGTGTQVEDAYQWYASGTTNAEGDLSSNEEYFVPDAGLLDIAVAPVDGAFTEGQHAPPGPISAADAILTVGSNDQGKTTDPARRVRAVPSVGSAGGGPVFLVGRGFPANASVTPDEDGDALPAVTTDAHGALVARDDDLDRDASGDVYPTSAWRFTEGTAYTGAGFARAGGRTVPPTAAVARTLVAPGTATPLVAVGLPQEEAITVRGLDARGTEVVVGTGTTDAVGALGPLTVTVPAGAAPGAYRLEVAAGTVRAYASLSVAGTITTLEATAAEEPVVVPPGGSADRTLRICDYDRAGRAVTVTPGVAWISTERTPRAVDPRPCENVTLAFGSGAPEAVDGAVSVVADDAPADEERTVGFRRLVRAAGLTSAAPNPADARKLADDPIVITGTASADRAVRVYALAPGSNASPALLGERTANGTGAWTLSLNAWPLAVGTYDIAVVPAEAATAEGLALYPQRLALTVENAPAPLAAIAAPAPAVLPPGAQTVARTLEVCNPDTLATRQVAVASKPAWLAASPAPLSIAPGSCATMTLTLGAGDPGQDSGELVLAPDAEPTRTVTIARKVRAAAVSSPAEDATLYADERVELSGAGTPARTVQLHALPPDGAAGEPKALGSAIVAGNGTWTHALGSWTAGLGGWRIVAIPDEWGQPVRDALTLYPGRRVTVAATRPKTPAPDDKDGGAKPTPPTPPAPPATTPPSPTPPAPPVEEPRPPAAGILKITVPSRTRIAALARNGLKVSLDLRGLDCAVRCAVTATLNAAYGPARLLGAVGSSRELAVAKATATVRRTTSAAVRLKLSRKGAARLRRMRKLGFRVRVTVVDAAGRRSSAVRATVASR